MILIANIATSKIPYLLGLGNWYNKLFYDHQGDSLIKLNPQAKKLEPKLRRLIETFLRKRSAADRGINICKLAEDVALAMEKDKYDLENVKSWHFDELSPRT